MPSGQVAGLIDDLPSCAELVARIMTEAEQRLASLGRAHRGQSRSMMVTFAWPPPSHMVTIPYRPPVRASA